MQRWKAAALASVLCSSVLSIWMCREGLLLSHRLGPALAPLRRLPRTLDARIARLAQCKPSPLSWVRYPQRRSGHNGGISRSGAGPQRLILDGVEGGCKSPQRPGRGVGGDGRWELGSLGSAVTRN